MQLDPTACPERQSNGSRWLFADAMLKLPNTQRREQKSFGACQRSGCGHGRSNIVAGLTAVSILAIPATGVRVEEPLPRFREIVIERGARIPPDRIALITMRGLISSSIPGNVSDSMVEDMRLALQQARDDNRVKAIVLEIDSPGGEVTASDQIYNAVTKARARKPVVVYMDSLTASGGYYIACGGKFLMANETTITGSIRM